MNANLLPGQQVGFDQTTGLPLQTPAQFGQISGAQGALNANAAPGSLNRYINMANEAIRRAADGSNLGPSGQGSQDGLHGRLNPEYFYSMQLLDTIRLDANQYVYYRYAEEMPIENKANRITVRRWTPLHAHTTPLVEGIPPGADRASAETYDILTMQYGRFMEFTDMVDVKLVDPVIANYTRQYSIVAIETLDMLARDALALVAQQYFAGLVATSLEEMTNHNVPKMDELRKIQLDMKRLLVKPRADGHYHVIAGPVFYYDMITDPRVEKFMRINKDTYTMYSNNALVPLFGMAFYETQAAPSTGTYVDDDGELRVRVMAMSTNSTRTLYGSAPIPTEALTPGYTRDRRTGAETDWNPNRREFTFGVTGAFDPTLPGGFAPGQGVSVNRWTAQAIVWNQFTDTDSSGNPITGDLTAAPTDVDVSTIREFKVAQVYVLGNEALIRTQLRGQGAAQVIVKALGSAGVNDPLNQRQSIGFKINSVGFGNARAEAVSVYHCVPTALNFGQTI